MNVCFSQKRSLRPLEIEQVEWLHRPEADATGTWYSSIELEQRLATFLSEDN